MCAPLCYKFSFCAYLLAFFAVITGPSYGNEPELRRTALVKAVSITLPATVNIYGKKKVEVGTSMVGNVNHREVNGMGTGVILDESGLILTNHHVVADIDRIHVKISLSLESPTHEFIASVVAYDARSDLALIRIKTNLKLPVIQFGTSSDILLGEPVAAIGNAYGYEDTITRGVISAKKRRVQLNDEQYYENLLQTDASINPGNSGGPLINILGETIGINAAVRVGAQSIGFAIPTNDALLVVDKMLKKQCELKIGETATFRTAFDGRTPKCLVHEIGSASPLYEAGLRNGDVVTSIGEQPTRWAHDAYRHLLTAKQEDKMVVRVTRDDSPVEIVLSSIATAKTVHPVAETAWSRMGIRAVSINKKFNTKKTSYRGGLKVLEVRADSPAAAQGIQPGDIILGIHKWETITLDNLSFVLENIIVRNRDSVSFYVYRDTEFLFGQISLSNK